MTPAVSCPLHSFVAAPPQVHNKAIRDINFSHNGKFVLAADDSGIVKISSTQLKPLQDIAAHELVRGVLWG